MEYSTSNTPQKDKSLKIRTFIYRRLQGNQNSSGLQCEVAYWPALAVGSAAQLAAAHCPNERFWTHISRFRRQPMVSGYVKILLSLSRRCRTIKKRYAVPSAICSGNFSKRNLWTASSCVALLWRRKHVLVIVISPKWRYASSGYSLLTIVA